MPREIAQQAAEEFTLAVWAAASLGRTTLMEIVSRHFEDEAIIRAVESRGGFRFKRRVDAVPKTLAAGAK